MVKNGAKVGDVSAPIGTQRFFSDALPAVIEMRAALFDRAQGRVCIIVHGVGAWTITFGDHKSPTALVPALELEADLVCTWSADQFDLLLSGNASDPEQLKPIALGDVRLLQKVGNLLQPPAKGGVGARFLNM